jgi:hypothetical protein
MKKSRISKSKSKQCKSRKNKLDYRRRKSLRRGRFRR